MSKFFENFKKELQKSMCSCPKCGHEDYSARIVMYHKARCRDCGRTGVKYVPAPTSCVIVSEEFDA